MSGLILPRRGLWTPFARVRDDTGKRMRLATGERLNDADPACCCDGEEDCDLCASGGSLPSSITATIASVSTTAAGTSNCNVDYDCSVFDGTFVLDGGGACVGDWQFTNGSGILYCNSFNGFSTTRSWFMTMGLVITYSAMTGNTTISLRSNFLTTINDPTPPASGTVDAELRWEKVFSGKIDCAGDTHSLTSIAASTVFDYCDNGTASISW